MATWRKDFSSLLCYSDNTQGGKQQVKGERGKQAEAKTSKSNPFDYLYFLVERKIQKRISSLDIRWIWIWCFFWKRREGGGRERHSGHPHPTRPKQYCKTTSKWRHSSHVDGQEQKHFSPLGTELYFHVNSLRKNSFVSTPNIAALSRGCKPRILATIIQKA